MLDAVLQSLQQLELQGPQIIGQNLEELIQPYIRYITFGIDIAAGVIIAISAAMALISFFKVTVEKSIEQQTRDKETIRLRLARGMLLALDFEVGSDILKTILVPSITELTILGVVVAIRIILSWSLSKEIERHSTGSTDIGRASHGQPMDGEKERANAESKGKRNSVSEA